MRCDICFGYFPPFDEVDDMIYRKWKAERDAAVAERRDQWRAAQ